MAMIDWIEAAACAAAFTTILTALGGEARSLAFQTVVLRVGSRFDRWTKDTASAVGQSEKIRRS